MLFPSGNPFKCHEEVLYLQPLIQPKRFDIFSPLTGGCSEGLGAFSIFLKRMRSGTSWLRYRPPRALSSSSRKYNIIQQLRDTGIHLKVDDDEQMADHTRK